MLTEKQVRAMFAAQDEARANEEWRRLNQRDGETDGEYLCRLLSEHDKCARQLEAMESGVVTVTDDDLYREDVEFAAVLVGNAGHLGFEELMAEARRVNDESAQAFLWSVEHALDGSDAR
jgi:hypothetical protein